MEKGRNIEFMEQCEMLSPIAGEKVSLVRIGGGFYVKKTSPTFNTDILLQLMEHQPRGIPKIYAFMENEDGVSVIEEFINGKSLQALLDQRGTFGENETLRIISALCDAVNELHCLSPAVIHRDIKPSNVLITNDNIVKLIDLDASRQWENMRNRDTVLLGTRGYASPEQFGFEQSGPRSDIYALGVLMNMMLLGCMPSQQIYKGRLGRIIKKCVALNPDDRYSGVLKLKEALPYVKREKIRDIMPVKEGFAPPGFRSKDPLKMIVALCGYTAVLALSFGFKKENYIQTYKMFADRLCFCAACFAIVCFY